MFSYFTLYKRLSERNNLKNSLKPSQGLKQKNKEPKTILGEHNRFSKDEDSGIQKGNEPAMRFFPFDI